jgi:hypothetical protein
MSIPTTGWKNKNGTANRSCNCGTWKQHWINYAKKSWPTSCSVKGCSTVPSLGAHVINANATGERIVPMCDSCNGLSGTFTLKEKITVPSANTSETCG